MKVKGEWVYLYRAIDKHGKTLDFMLSKRRNKAAATRVFARALEVNGLPRKIVIDKSGGNISTTSPNRITGSSNEGSDPCWDSNPSAQPHLS